MKEKYLELVELTKETVGSSFVLGFSLRSQKHYIQFANKPKRIEAYDIETCIIVAIDYIKGTRKERPDKQDFTMHI